MAQEPRVVHVRHVLAVAMDAILAVAACVRTIVWKSALVVVDHAMVRATTVVLDALVVVMPRAERYRARVNVQDFVSRRAPDVEVVAKIRAIRHAVVDVIPHAKVATLHVLVVEQDVDITRKVEMAYLQVTLPELVTEPHLHM